MKEFIQAALPWVVVAVGIACREAGALIGVCCGKIYKESGTMGKKERT